MGVAPISVPQSLALVLNSAGEKSDVDFDYLLQTAMRESSLNPEAKASGSSAVGLFQFLDSTWLQTMKEQGPRLGYQQYADQITRNSDGDYTVANKDMRNKILALREDPQVAADLAAAFTQSNGAYLEDKFGRMPSAGELYIAHFLGPQGAEKMFRAGLDNPNQIAADLFPRQAKANPQIFYSDGQARTIRDVYKALVAKHNGAVPAIDAAPAFVTQQIANTSSAKWPEQEIPSRFSKADMSFTSLFSDTPINGVQPLVAMDGSSPLLAINAAVPESQPETVTAEALGFVPLPAPAPLSASDFLLPEAPPQPVDLTEPGEPVDLVASSADSIPQPRILMTPRPEGAPSSAFLTQLFWQE